MQDLMPHHPLHLLTVSVPLRLQRVQNAAKLLFLLLRQFYFPRSKVLLKTLCFGRSRNRDHALRNDPRQSNLRQRAAFALRNGFDLLNDLLVVVEVLALEFGDWLGVLVCYPLFTQSRQCCEGEVGRGKEVGLPVRRKSSGAKSSGL